MPRVPVGLINLTVTSVTAEPGGPPITADLLLMAGDDDQFADVDLTVTSILAEAYASPDVMIGASVSIDRGAGLVAVTASELAAPVSISRKLGSYAPEATVTLVSPSSRPLRDLWMQTKGAMVIVGYYGTAGHVTSRPLFSGFITRPSQSDQTITLTAYGRASLVSESLVTIAVDPGSRRTRGSVVREVIASLVDGNGSPITEPISVDLGPTDGGIIVKPVSEGGTRKFYDWVREFLSPVGAYAGEAHGRIVIKRWARTATARTIPSREIIAGSVNVSPASIQDPNLISVSGSIFDPDFVAAEAGETSYTVEEQSSLNPYEGAFMIPTADFRQDGSGVLTASGLTPQALFAGYPITLTRTEKFTSPDVARTIQTQFGFYAPRCTSRYRSGGAIGYHYCHRYPDKTFSRAQRHAFIEIKKTIETETKIPGVGINPLNGLPRVGMIRRERLVYGYANPQHAIAIVDAFGARNVVNSELTIEGVGYVQSAETYGIVSREVEESIADQQGLVATVITKLYENAATPADVNEEDTYIYGPYSSERGGAEEQESFRLVATTTKTYITLGEGRYVERTAPVTITGGALPIEERVMNGSRPALDLASNSAPIGKSQVNRQSFRDDGAIARAGVEIKDDRQNEYAETDAELRFIARDLRAGFASSNVDASIGYDVSTDIGDTIILDRDPVAGFPLLVDSMSISIDLATGANSVSIGAVYTPEAYL